MKTERIDTQRASARGAPERSAETPAPPWRVYALVAFVALLVRGLYLWQIVPAAFFDLRMGDGLVYHRWAMRIAGGEWLSDHVFYQAPLYPYVLGLIYSVLGDGMLAIRLVQALMGTGACVLIAVATNAFFGARAGLLAGLMLAVFTPAIFMESLIQKTALGGVLTAAFVAGIGALTRSANGRRWLAIGIVLGLLALTRENALVFLAPLLIWLLVNHSRRLAWATLFAVGMSIALLPAVVHNRLAGGETLLTTSQFGTNFYIGNHPDHEGTYTPISPDRGDALFERIDATRIAEQAVGRKLTGAEVSQYWRRRTFDAIGAQPLKWLRLVAWKAAMTCNAAEIPDTEAQEIYAESSTVLRGLGHFAHFGTLFAMAAFGIVMTAASWRRLWVIYLMAACYAASVVMFFVSARYRFPLAMFLIPPAAAGLVEAAVQIGQRRFRRLACALLVAVAVAVGTNWPLVIHGSNRVLAYNNIANALSNDPGKVDVAVEYYERALNIDVDDSKVHNDYGSFLTSLGRTGAAIRHLRKSVRLQPGYVAAHHNLGIAYERQDDRAAAERQYLEALRLDPTFAEGHNALATLLAADGRLASAIEHFREAIRLDPENASAHNNLGAALVRTGKLEQGATHYRRAIELRPDFDLARRNLKIVLQALADRPLEDR